MEDVEFQHNLDNESRIEFLKSLSVLCVPERHGEACGLYVLEALGCGVPVVQPDNGVFSELLELTKGGVLVEGGNVSALAEGLEQLLARPDYARQLGMQGREKIRERFDIERSAKDFIDILEKVVDKHSRGQ